MNAWTKCSFKMLIRCITRAIDREIGKMIDNSEFNDSDAVQMKLNVDAARKIKINRQSYSQTNIGVGILMKLRRKLFARYFT